MVLQEPEGAHVGLSKIYDHEIKCATVILIHSIQAKYWAKYFWLTS